MAEETVLESAKGALQDLVVVASLVHQLTDSFGSAVDLYRKLKQNYRKITESDSESEEHHRRFRRRRESGSNHDSRWDRRAHRSISRRRGDEEDSDEETVLKSSIIVQAEYERGYRNFGEKFARGDLITQIQLQSQIIHVQQTLLDIYRDLTLSNYLTPSSQSSHVIRLVQTVRIARTASIEALTLQSKRMLVHVPEEPVGRPHIPGGFPVPSHGHDHEHHEPVPVPVPLPLPLPRRKKSKSRHRRKGSSSSSSSSDSDDGKPPIPGVKLPHKPHPSHRLFCVYARDLQRDKDQPLSDNYKAGGNGCCPYCKTHIPIRPGKAWELIKDDEKIKGLERTFQVGNRFIIKCHREGGGFACALCVKHRDADVVSKEIRGLIEHMWNDHTCMEIDEDDDIEQMVKTWT